ncbi:MAG: carbohydrate kinase family protein [Candidatus Gallimonas sp.]
MKKTVGVAGNILLDVVKRIECWPQRGMLVNINGVSHAIGGCVGNTAIDLKRLDKELNVRVFGRIGQDEYGDFVLRVMREEGLDVSPVVRSEKLPTSFTDVMTLPDGERTFFHARGANAEFTEEDVGGERCDLFHLGYLLLLDELDKEDEKYGTKAARLLARMRASGAETSIDLVSAQTGRFRSVVTPALEYCDHVVINEIEGGMLTDIPPRDGAGKPVAENLEKICARLFELGVKKSVVIHCPELSCAMDKAGNFSLLPSLNLPKGYIAGSVGAGDAFCAGMLYSFACGLSLDEGMRIASCAAACNLSATDSISGARGLADTLALENKFGRRILSC